MVTRVNIRTCLAAIVAIGFAAACREITVPDVHSMRGATGKTSLNPSGRVVVYPDSMRGWSFYYDQTEAVCTTSPACRMVLGPGTPPLGSGSAEFEGSSAIHGKALILADYAGTRFDEITDLRYSTYRQTADTGNSLAISLEFNVDYNLNDPAKGYQGRLVFEPSAGIGGNVSQNSWQTWDARAGKWWGTKAIVTGSGASAANPCVQATPCTWAALLAAFPSIGVHSRFGAVILKAGTGWSGFRGNVDKLTIAIAGISTTYDFELTASPLVPASAPATPPWNLITAARIIRAPSALGYPVFADLVQVRFAEGTPVSERVAAVAAVGGSVVGGYSTGFAEGYYVLQLSADSSGMLIRNAMQSLRSRSSVANTRPVLALLGAAAYSRSNEGTGLGLADWILNPDSAFAGAAAAWAASAVAAPFAWGCATGTGITGAIIDMGLAPNADLLGRIEAASYTTQAEATDILTHGQAVASVFGATAGNGLGVAGIANESGLLLLDVSTRRGDDSTRIDVTLEGTAVPSDISIFDAWMKARDSKALVVNISLGGETAPTDSLRQIYATLVSEMKRVLLGDSSGWDPLIVLAAGNAGAGARHDWSAVGLLRDSLDTRTIVVGGAAKVRKARWPLTSSGGIIDIYAPADSVAMYTSHKPDRWTWSGTSFAAPLVSGAAALLFSFDPRLRAQDVRELLVSNPDTARMVAGVMFLDAYRALRRAAERPGAPICGNRVWRSADSIFVQRGQAIESIGAGSASALSASDLVLYHGGKHVEFDNATALSWDAQGLWHTAAPGSTSATPTGFYWSTKGYDHDGFGSSWTMLSNGTVEAYWLDEDYNTLRSTTGALPPLPASNVTTPCAWQIWRNAPSKPDSVGVYPRYECGSTGYEGVLERYREGNSGGSMSPDGRFTLLAVNVIENTYSMSSWNSCKPGTYRANVGNPTTEHPNLCRDTQFSERPRNALLVVADSANGLVRVASGVAEAARNIDWIGVSEDGKELVLQSSRCVVAVGSTTKVCTDGRVDWRVLALSNALVGSANFSRPVSPVVYSSRVTAAAVRTIAENSSTKELTHEENARRARIAAEPAVRKRLKKHGGMLP